MADRNEFRIPGDGGTLVDLAPYDSGPAGAFRATLTWDLTPRHALRLLTAPLRHETPFTPESPVVFQQAPRWKVLSFRSIGHADRPRPKRPHRHLIREL